ncbi:uncharacterized protein isoform X3 [Rhodnius prolixus]|uniref:uncharacterized protein isoform X3 n=1 Tax=Rhodnius prolixus TaxID=13249 RepID=UPI003D18ABFE
MKRFFKVLQNLFTMSSENYKTVCRLCLASNLTLISILEPFHDFSQIIEKVSACLPVKISKEDPYSKQICEKCIFKLEEFNEFRNSTVRCQRILESWERNARLARQQKDSGQKNFNRSSESSDTCNEEEIEDHGLIGSVTEGSEEESDEEEQEDIRPIEIVTVTSEIASRESERPVNSNKLPTGNEIASNSQNTSTSFPPGNALDRYPENENIQTDTTPVESTNSAIVAENKTTKSPEKTVQLAVKIKKSKEYLCKECGKKFNNREKFTSHTATHYKVYNCSECPYKSKYATNFKIHMMKHSGQFLVNCKVCKKGYYSMQYYKSHFRLKHSKEISTYKCHDCGKIYGSRLRLKQHLIRHKIANRGQRYQCEICGKLCLSYKGMKTHLLIVHEGKRFTCDICNKIVTSRQSLKYHKMRHKREKTHVCDVCGKGFVGQSNLLVHKRVHTGDRPYKCNLCDRSFTQNITLIVHKRQHSGERPFRCNFCDKRYVCNSNLNRHKKTHKS